MSFDRAAFPKEFSVRIKKVRLERRLLSKEVRYGAKISNYSSLEKGNKMPSTLAVVKLAVFFNVSLEYLVYGKEYNYISKNPTVESEIDKSLMEKFEKINELGGESKMIALHFIDLLIYKKKYKDLVGEI